MKKISVWLNEKFGLLFLFILLVLAVVFMPVWGEYHLASKNRAQLNELSSKIEAIEKARMDTIFKGKLEAKELSLKIQEAELKTKNIETDLRKDYDWLLRFGIPGTILAFFLLFGGIYKTAFEFAKKQAREDVQKVFRSEEELVKKEKKILVLTPKDGDTNFLRKFFIASGFEKDEFPATQNEGLLTPTSQHDLILVNNESNSESFKKIAPLLHSPSTMVFYFGPPKLDDAFMKDQRVSSAGFKSQIYGNLINALKFQRYLIDLPIEKKTSPDAV